MMLPAIVLLPLLAAFLPMFTRHLGRRWCALLVALPVVALFAPSEEPPLV